MSTCPTSVSVANPGRQVTRVSAHRDGSAATARYQRSARWSAYRLGVKPRRCRRWKYSHEFVDHTRSAIASSSRSVRTSPVVAQVGREQPHVGRPPLVDLPERLGAGCILLTGERQRAQQRSDLGLQPAHRVGVDPQLRLEPGRCDHLCDVRALRGRDRALTLPEDVVDDRQHQLRLAADARVERVDRHSGPASDVGDGGARIPLVVQQFSGGETMVERVRAAPSARRGER